MSKQLAQDQNVFSPRNLFDSASLSSYDTATLRREWKSWIEIASRQRLLLACYVLDQQCSALLARPQSYPSLAVGQLAFPDSTALWEAGSAEEFSAIVFRDFSISQTIHDAALLAASVAYDPFQSAVLIAAGLGDADIPVDKAFTSVRSQSVESSRCTRLFSHVAHLVRVTPLRDLLAVSGESWCLSRKISHEEHVASSRRLFRWAASSSGGAHLLDGQEDVNKAVGHALAILRNVTPDLRRSNPPTGALIEDMAVYVAALVLWAYTAVRLRIFEQSSPEFLPFSVVTAVGTPDEGDVVTFLAADTETLPLPGSGSLNGDVLTVSQWRAGRRRCARFREAADWCGGSCSARGASQRGF